MRELFIEGRQIVPVRLIPEVTGRAFSAESLALLLSNQDERTFPDVDLTAYRLTDPGTYVPVLPRDWDNVVRDHGDLVKRYEGDEHLTDAQWREESCELFFAGTYVWLDDLNKALRLAFASRHWETADRRKGDREINLNVPVSPRIEKLGYEGFGNCFGEDGEKAGPSTEEAPPYVFRRLNIGTWQFAFAGISYDAEKHRVGFHQIHHLLQNPGKDISALQLMQLTTGKGVLPDSGVNASNGDDWGSVTTSLGDAGEILDPKTLRNYKATREYLREKIIEAEESGDHEDAAESRSQFKWIDEQIKKASSPTTRIKRERSDKEKATNAVRENGRNALARLDKCCPKLAEHLRESLKWGLDCSYRPAQTLKWRLF